MPPRLAHIIRVSVVGLPTYLSNLSVAARAASVCAAATAAITIMPCHAMPCYAHAVVHSLM